MAAEETRSKGQEGDCLGHSEAREGQTAGWDVVQRRWVSEPPEEFGPDTRRNQALGAI